MVAVPTTVTVPLQAPDQAKANGMNARIIRVTTKTEGMTRLVRLFDLIAYPLLLGFINIVAI
jgi:hypothetical protein